MATCVICGCQREFPEVEAERHKMAQMGVCHMEAFGQHFACEDCCKKDYAAAEAAMQAARKTEMELYFRMME